MTQTTSDTNVDTGTTEQTQAVATKTYTQEEFDNHMAGLKSSLTKKLTKQYEDLGDIETLRELKAQAEKRQMDDAKKRGEFDAIIKDLAAKKDSEIQKRDAIIKDYKVNAPLVNAAAKFRAVAPEQVKSLLINSVRLNGDGEVEVVDAKGSVRYTDNGTPLAVEDLVQEFLLGNPHFVSATPATTNTKSSISNSAKSLDISKLDMKNPEHRALYREYRKANGIA